MKLVKLTKEITKKEYKKSFYNFLFHAYGNISASYFWYLYVIEHEVDVKYAREALDIFSKENILSSLNDFLLLSLPDESECKGIEDFISSMQKNKKQKPKEPWKQNKTAIAEEIHRILYSKEKDAVKMRACLTGIQQKMLHTFVVSVFKEQYPNLSKELEAAIKDLIKAYEKEKHMLEELESILSKAQKVERLKLLGQKQIILALERDPEKYAFILDDPFLNDEDFWSDEKRVKQVVDAGTNSDKLKVLLDVGYGDLNIYFDELDQHIPYIVNATRLLLQSEKYSGGQYIFLGRGADLIYYSSLFFLGRRAKKESYLLDDTGHSALYLAEKNKKAFAEYLAFLELNKNKKVLIVDECVTKEEKLKRMRTLFNSIKYNNTVTVSIAYDLMTVRSNLNEFLAMVWLASLYNSGRSSKVKIKNDKWVYEYSNSDSSGRLTIGQNGEVLGWLNRMYLYHYLISQEEKMNDYIEEIKHVAVDDFQSTTLDREKIAEIQASA